MYAQVFILKELHLIVQDFHPKLSDFGLARDGPTGDNTHVSTRVIGTQGYAAPEYVATGILANAESEFLLSDQVI